MKLMFPRATKVSEFYKIFERSAKLLLQKFFKVLKQLFRLQIPQHFSSKLTEHWQYVQSFPTQLLHLVFLMTLAMVPKQWFSTVKKYGKHVVEIRRLLQC